MIVLGILFGLILGLMAGTIIANRRRKSSYLSSTEFWVFQPGVTLPPQEAIMHRMLADNPYGKRGVSPVGPQEGILFSDIRTHIALVLKSKNPHAFRGDLFVEVAEPTPEQLELIHASESLSKVRYVSETPLPDKRHLTFTTHASDAIAELSDAKLIYDVAAERLWDRDAFEEQLRKDPTGTGPAMHVRSIWKSTAWGGVVETRGLSKIGVRDLVSTEVPADQRVIVLEVLDAAARLIWECGSVSDPMEISAFDDAFRLKPMPVKDGRIPVRILRVQAT